MGHFYSIYRTQNYLDFLNTWYFQDGVLKDTEVEDNICKTGNKQRKPLIPSVELILSRI